jgi:hypothetical protein
VHKSTKKKHGVALTGHTAKQGAAKASGRSVRQVPMIDAETAKLTASEYCLFHYPTLYTAGTPCLVAELIHRVWMVPIVLATPARGVLGRVGELRVDAQSGKVIASTDRDEVVARGEQLWKGKRNAAAPRVPTRE